MTQGTVAIANDHAGVEMKRALMAELEAMGWRALDFGTGIGISIAANRVPGVRAAVCHDATTARLARAHNDSNVMALGARVIGFETARDCLKAFLETAFDGGERHERRVRKLG